jgi:hypothetical protein
MTDPIPTTKTLSGIPPGPVHSHTPTKGNAMSALSRRSLVTSAAALPALAVPAVAALAEPDPIYAAIEKDRALYAAFIARCDYEGGLEKSGVKLVPGPGEGEYGRTFEMVAAVDASVNARKELANTAPATLAGLAAYLDYVLAETDKLSSDDFPTFFFDGEEETLDFVRSLRRGATALALQS